MRKSAIALFCFTLAIFPAQADTMLAPGKPAGVKAAQAQNAIYMYGGLLLFGAFLYVVVNATSGNSVTSTSGTTTG
jgi:hypothetical protein